MATFIELKSDEELLTATAPYSMIVIVGCRKCANVSLAYSYNCPLAVRAFDRGINAWEPFAIVETIKRLETLLRSSGKRVYIEIETPCELMPEKEVFMAARRTDISAILSVACLAGKVGIEKTVGGGLPILSATNTVGLIQAWIDVDATHLRVNSQKSTVVRFQSDIPETVDLTEYWDIINQE